MSWICEVGWGVGATCAQLVHLVLPLPAPACMPACLLICILVSDLLLDSSSVPPQKTEQPAFILEGKEPVESRRGDGRNSPASLPLTQTQSPGPWQSESLLAESWSTMGDVDPEDTKSVDSSDGAVLAGEENHSSNSDMVHLEREEAEMLEDEEEEERRWEKEEGGDLQASMLSMLGGERELRAPETEEVLMSVEGPHTERDPAQVRQVVPPMTLPPLPIVKLDPPSTTSTPVPSTTASEVEDLCSTQSLQPPSILTPRAAEPPERSLGQPKFSNIPLSDAEEHPVKSDRLKKRELNPRARQTKSLSSSELLFGGAALVAVVGVVAYGAVVYCKK
ncbi:bcl-2-like protein 13 isoform X1 [Nothobranchius furzeri]|uniref:Bcl-2-like protein 13 n=2 Tax=Nothobranchius furzeri TaxID=105023 RepID=A0A9D3C2Q0_NOTFU|nr:bcl-2-like protein 13 [Nothobranchius furzeri]